MKTITVTKALARRELILALRNKTDKLAAISFFVITLSLFPIALNAEPTLLKTVSPCAFWIAALFSISINANNIFLDDYQDKTLEQLLLTPLPFSVGILIKVAIHWVSAVLPLIILSPLLAIQFNLNPKEICILMMSLAIGTPALMLTSAIGSAATLGARNSGVLITIITTPLNIPAIIFGSSALSQTISGGSPENAITMLAALLLLTIVVAPLAIATSIRIALD
jgi:heme exporter protein B